MRGRTSAKRFSCPFHKDRKLHPGEAAFALQGTSKEVHEGCEFRGTARDLEGHLALCPDEAEEVSLLAQQMAAYFSAHPDLASEAASLVHEVVARVHTGALDERRERFHDQRWREVVVRGIYSVPMQERLGWARGGTVVSQDSHFWTDFLAMCLPGFNPLRIPMSHKQEHIVEDMLVCELRNDHSDKSSFVPGVHSFRVWCKALTAASIQQCAPEATSKLLEAIGVSGGTGGQAQVKAAFKKWDVDGNGFISKLELGCVLRALDSSFTLDVIDKLFAFVDTNHDGDISYEEFIAWLFAHEPVVESGLTSSKTTTRGFGDQFSSHQPGRQKYAPARDDTVPWESMTLSSALR